jgi:hypothetical protein
VHSVVSLHVRRKAAVDWNVSIIDLTLLKHDAQICRKFYCFGFLHVEYRQVSFYARAMFPKNVVQIEVTHIEH